MNCPKCNSIAAKNGTTKDGKQKYRCNNCKHNFEVRKGEEPILEIETTGIGISETQLRAKHDLRYIVESKCAGLKKGVFMTQAEFVQFCKINPGAGYRGVIEHPEYDKYHGKAGGVNYWSHPDSIKKLKDEGVLM
jgi:hypothetical protein